MLLTIMLIEVTDDANFADLLTLQVSYFLPHLLL